MARFKVIATSKGSLNSGPGYGPEMEALGPIDAEIVEIDTLTDEEYLAEARDADAIIIGHEKISAGIITGLERCKVISTGSVGTDGVDVEAATRKGIPITNVPDTFIEEVADHTMALLLGSFRRLTLMDTMSRDGRWSEGRPYLYSFPRLMGQTLGLIGLGRIGRSTAVRGVALGMPVIAHELYPDREFVEQHGIELVSQDELLARSDFVSVHCPLNEETHGLCDGSFFAKMKNGAVFINTSRGGLVVEADLVQTLESGHLQGAGLDVFDPEPPTPDNPLFGFDNVVLSPHVAGTDERSMEGMGVECAENIIALLNGDWPEASIVNRSLKERWLSQV